MKTVCANCGSPQGRFNKGTGKPLCKDVTACVKRRDNSDAEKLRAKQ